MGFWKFISKFLDKYNGSTANNIATGGSGGSGGSGYGGDAEGAGGSVYIQPRLPGIVLFFIIFVIFAFGFFLGLYSYFKNNNSPKIDVITESESATTTKSIVNDKIEVLKKEIELLKRQKNQIPKKDKDEGSERFDFLTEEEIARISKSIVHLGCYFQNGDQQFGTGVYLKTAKDIYVVTNFHVVNNGIATGDCLVYFYDTFSKRNDFPYELSLVYTDYYNSTDLAFLRLKNRPIGDFGEHSNNYLEIDSCSEDLMTGAKVYVFGYPLSGRITETLKTTSGTIFQLIVTEGIISGLVDTTVVYKGSYHNPPPNYLTSAKIDSGNSGGLAVSKVHRQVCLVGVPTWISKGRFDNLGVVQSFRHVNALIGLTFK